MVFGRTLTESRLIKSANYVQTELPTRLAHRIRDMQTLPYIVVTNPHISQVYQLYCNAFESIRAIGQVETLQDNTRLCEKIKETLDEHLSVIPKLAMGMLECQDLMKPEEIDKFMNTILRSRISRRVIAKQHLSLTRTFCIGDHASSLKNECVGEVFLKCNANTVISRCVSAISNMCSASYGPSITLPQVRINGHLTAQFPYILSHLEYIVGELLRNSIQATVETHKFTAEPPPIEFTICESSHHIIIRVSDRGGGIDPSVLPYLWSFSSKGSRRTQHLNNLSRVPRMAATMQELRVSDPCGSLLQTVPASPPPSSQIQSHGTYGNDLDISSLNNLSERPSNLRLGMGLPLSRVYAEYWAGSLEVHNLEGYGVDTFLRISKLGNHNEQVTTRAIIDAL
ncbi:hypothetical protein K3495_g7348 [Podosphaera aphanis]|nr:hypothetical protein K3495_g7348 [Podosphaera aphanis]